jgi:antitoxin HicB
MLEYHDAETVTQSALIAAKLALRNAMTKCGVNNCELARQLGLQENGVRRLLDLDHRSHIDSIQKAMAVLGRRLVVSDEPIDTAMENLIL